MTFDIGRERDDIDRIAADSWYSKGANAAMVRYCAQIWRRVWRGTSCLELGPAEGLMTASLAEVFPDLTIVEGSSTFCAELSRRYPTAKVICSLFEEFRPRRQFDAIVMGHVLEMSQTHVLCCPLPAIGLPMALSSTPPYPMPDRFTGKLP